MKKTLSIFTGSLFLGFGIGTLLLKEVELSDILITLITIVSLIIGGFLIAVGIINKKPKQDEKEISNNNSK